SLPDIQLPVVQAIPSRAPELDALRAQTIAAPERRTRNVPALVLPLERLVARFQLRAARQRLALSRRPRADPASPRAAGEVVVGVLRRRDAHRTFDPHLLVQPRPVAAQRGPRVLAQLAALARLVVRVEAEAELVDAAQEHDPRRRPPVAGRGGEHHCGGIERSIIRRPRVELAEALDGID